MKHIKLFEQFTYETSGKTVVDEARIVKDGQTYNIEEIGELDALNKGGIPMDKAYAGKDGILGNNNTYISWSDVKRLMNKYAR